MNRQKFNEDNTNELDKSILKDKSYVKSYILKTCKVFYSDDLTYVYYDDYRNKLEIGLKNYFKIPSYDKDKYIDALKKTKLGAVRLRRSFDNIYTCIVGVVTKSFLKGLTEFVNAEKEAERAKKAAEEEQFNKDVSAINLEDVTISNKDFEKMISYYDKKSNPDRLVKSIKDKNKMIARYMVAVLLDWVKAEYAFESALGRLGLSKVEIEAYKRRAVSLGIPQQFQDKIQELKNSGVGGFGHEGKALNNWAGLPKLDKWLYDNKIKYTSKSVNTPSWMLDADRRNGSCWTCAYELKIGDLTFIVANHTSESGRSGAWGFSMEGEGKSVHHGSQQDIINAIDSVLNKEQETVQESLKIPQTNINQLNEDIKKLLKHV